MENEYWIDFQGKSFCFTGSLLDISRSVAENEVKLRNGYISERVTSQLDYLIVGTTPNPQWKYGKYGNKIQTAINLRNKVQKPFIIQECDFIDALSLNFPIKDDHVAEKILVIKYNFYDFDESEDVLKPIFTTIAEQGGLLFVSEKTTFNEFALWDDFAIEKFENVTKYTYTLIQKFFFSDDLFELTANIKDVLLDYLLVLEKLTIKEVKEGSSAFIRYSNKYKE